MSVASHHARLCFTQDPAEAFRSRRWLEQELARHFGEPEKVADALVMASELVSNVLCHTSSEGTLTLAVSAHALFVSVHDDGTGCPVVRPADPHRIGGNGIRIVDAWAREWGITPDAQPGPGKSVWFRT